jgi:O-antigen ligase
MLRLHVIVTDRAGRTSRLDSTMQPGFEPQEPPRVRSFGVSAVQLVAVTYGAWLLSLSVAFHIQAENKILLELVLLAGAVPAVLNGMFLRVDTRGNAPGMWFLWGFLVIFLLSYMFNECTWEDLVNLFNVLFVFLVGFLIASTTDTSLIGRIAAVYAVMLTPYLLYINLTGERIWGRLHAGSQPNLWGLLAVNVAIGAFALRSRLLQAGCMVVVLMTLYNAQARGSMVALTPIVFVYTYHWYIHQRNIDISWKLIVTYLLFVVAFCFVAFYSDIIINDIMRLNDPYRGLQSGATGRDEAWAEALRLWFNSPLFGVGFRKHEDLMVFTDLSSHNAYIAMLADTGFVGFLAYMAFLIASLIAAMRGVTDNKLRLLLLGVIVSYACAGMFERRAINVGNSFSITFIFVCLTALRLAQLRFRYENGVRAAPIAAPQRR